MKYLLLILMLISYSVCACSDQAPFDKPYATPIFSMEKNDAKPYQIVVPKQNGSLFLTTLRIDIPDLIASRLEYEEHYEDKEYYSAFIWISENQIDNLKIRLMYSTNEKGWVAMCGEFIEYEFSALISEGKNKK